jgi:hypothetical protein
VSDGGVVSCTSSLWSGVVYDSPLRRSHSWFEVRILRTGFDDGVRRANVCIGVTASLDNASCPGLSDDSVGFDLSVSEDRCPMLHRGFDQRVGSSFADVSRGAVLFVALVQRADGGMDVTWGCNRFISGFHTLPATSSLSKCGGCYPVVAVCGAAEVQLLPLQPNFEVVRRRRRCRGVGACLAPSRHLAFTECFAVLRGVFLTFIVAVAAAPGPHLASVATHVRGSGLGSVTSLCWTSC